MSHAGCMNVKERTITRAMIGVAAAALSLTLVACGTDNDVPTVDVDPTATDTPGSVTDLSPSPETTTDAATDETGTDEPAEAPADDDTHAGVLAAIESAQAATGGTAFEVDDADGGSWEIYIADGDDELEVLVTSDGSEIILIEREGGLDASDSDGLAAATITISEAIVIAADHGEGLIDDVNLDREGSGFAWEVTFVNDVEVYIDVASGEIIRVEQD